MNCFYYYFLNNEWIILAMKDYAGGSSRSEKNDDIEAFQSCKSWHRKIEEAGTIGEGV